MQISTSPSHITLSSLRARLYCKIAACAIIPRTHIGLKITQYTAYTGTISATTHCCELTVVREKNL